MTAPRIVERIGTTRVVVSGLTLMAITFAWIFTQLSPEAQALAGESVVAAQRVANDLGAAAPGYLNEVSDAFMSGFNIASLAVAVVAAAGAIFTAKFLPAQAGGNPDRRDPEPTPPDTPLDRPISGVDR